MMSKALCAGLAAASLFSSTDALDTAPSCSQYGIGYNDPLRAETPNGGLLATAKDCQATCQRTVYCEHFSFYNNSGGCWLQGDNVTEISSPYIISGPMLCPGEEKAAFTGGVGPTTPLALNPVAQAIWAKVEAGNATGMTTDLSSMGPPDTVATQVVSGMKYIFSWKDGSNITVLDQPWTQTLEITDTSLTGAVKSKEIETDGTATMEQPTSSEGGSGSGGLAWWAWLLIAIGIILLLVGIAYMCMGGSKKSKKTKKNKTADRDLETAQPEQKQPLVSAQATETAAASGVAPPMPQQYVSAGGTPMIMPQAQSAIPMPMVQSGVRSIPAGYTVAPAQYVTSQVYQSPQAGGMSAAGAQDMFTQLDANGDGVLSQQEFAALSQGQR